MAVQDKLVDWFTQFSGEQGFDLEQNYFESGLIDSFDLIELMTYCEGEFNIQFSENQFEDRRFSTIAGLSEIIEQLQQD